MAPPDSGSSVRSASDAGLPRSAGFPEADAPALHWRRVKALLAEALELPAAERADFVDRAAGPDTALRTELLTLITAADHSRTPLDDGPSDLALQALEARSAQAWIGRRLGAYQLLSALGAGGMGQVYRAERADGQYKRQVAVKLMLPGPDRAAALQRFQSERQILASLDHPNLARLLDAGMSDEGVPYFVMELIDGEPVDAYCARHALPLDQRLRMFRQVCQVVHYAHQQGVVHRDLKPANILVTSDGVVKLVDFGIAKRLPGPTHQMQPQTQTAQRVMTLEYASPEQVRGEAATPASDVFSLGVVLYRLLTGAGPYSGTQMGSDYALSQAICEAEAPPPSRQADRALRRQLAGDLDALVLMALRKEPAARYASAEHLADDVFRHLERLPVQARRGAWSYRAGRFMLRHRAAMGAVAVANVLLLAAAGVATYQAYEATRQKQRADRHVAGVRKLANTFIFDVHDAIQELPGSTSARKMLAETARQYLQQLGSEPQMDDGLRRELAVGYRKLGDVQGRPYAPNLGDASGALASYSQAVDLLRPLLKTPPHAQRANANTANTAKLANAADLATPADRDTASELTIAHQRRAALLASAGRFDDALAAFTAAAELADRLVQQSPDDITAGKRRASIRASIAQLQLASGQFDQYLASSAQVVQLYEALRVRWPQDRDLVRNLSSLHGMHADYLIQRDMQPETARTALQSYRHALAVLEPVHRADPDNAMVSRDLAIHHNGSGEALLRLKQAADATAESRRAIALMAALVQRDPANVAYRSELATTRTSLSHSLLEQGDTAGALAAAQSAVALFEALPPDALRDLTTRYRQAMGHYHLGRALSRRGDAAAACMRLRTSLPVLEELEKQGGGLSGGNLQPATVRAAIAAGCAAPG
jgi:tetratricopeptide (TPR) repeat protein/tRNA A-37 threonylcarbamoyl transferase component Bud32